MRIRLMGAATAVGLAAVIWGASAAQARELFVSPLGNDSNAGTKEAPFRTIAKASELASAGDAVMLAAGTYEETIEPVQDGLEGRPIVHQGERRAAAGASGPVAHIANVGTGAVVTNRSWITFRNLSFGNCTEQWMYGGDAHHSGGLRLRCRGESRWRTGEDAWRGQRRGTGAGRGTDGRRQPAGGRAPGWR